MLQQVTAEVQPRHAAQVNSALSLDSSCMMVNISHSLITSSALDSIWRSKSHTRVVEEVAGPRYLSISAHSHIAERCLATAVRVSEIEEQR